MIYCVEDEGAIRDLMIYTLKASGFEAQGFENSIGFWSAMKAQKPELIITVLTVKDTGIGIPEESRERIFERFYRIDKSRSKEVGGTGLDLSIVKHGVLIHNGKIEVNSEPGKGTEFVVTIPNEQEVIK